MRSDEQIRFWKDADFRDAQSDEARRHARANPAGAVELTDDEMDAVAGGKTEYLLSLGCCGGFTDQCYDLTQGVVVCTNTCTTIWMTTDAVCRPQQ
jgi:mersacidin/lichenicidin family type 2 lantibiotic